MTACPLPLRERVRVRGLAVIASNQDPSGDFQITNPK
jgi:hypothetical protein